MAGKFIVLEDAAKLLGVSAEEMIDMRSRGEIFGYRDGASWKFKMEEIQRVADDKGISLAGTDSAEPSSFDDDFDDLLGSDNLHDDLLADDDEGSSILVNDQEVGRPEDSTSSTVIGAGTPADAGVGSDDDDLKLATEESAIGLDASDVSLVPDAASDVRLVAGGSDVLSGADSELKLTSGSGTGDLAEELGLGSDALDLGSDIDLALGDDDDLVLGASGAGSDVTLDSSGSGINLSSPSDSGLSLEDEPLELAGSGAGSSLELPEEEDFISLDDIADPDEATQLKQDEEFLLSPSDDLEVDSDDSDSGSQVIALEDSEAFDQDAATMVQPGAMAGGMPDLSAQVTGGGMGAPMMGVAPGMAPGAVPGMMPTGAPQPAAAYVPMEPPEASYSIWNVLSLLLVIMILSLTGMLMTDLIRNMWSWDGEYSATTSIMDGIYNMLPGN